MRRIFSYSYIIAFAIIFYLLSAGATDIYPAEPEVSGASGFVGYAADRIIVKFDPSVVESMDRREIPRGRTGIPAFDQVGKDFGVTSIRSQFPGARKRKFRGRTIDLRGWHKVKFAKITDVISAVKKYKEIPGVIEAEPVGIHRVHAVPNDPSYDQQWHLSKIEAPVAWNIETGNSEIIVAILDTGVRYFAKDLGGADASYSTPTVIDGNMWVNAAEKNGTQGIDDDGNGYVDDWIGYDFVETTSSITYPCFNYAGYEEDCDTADNDPRDFNSHGTHCSGIVAAINNNGDSVASPSGGWGNGTLEASGNGVRIMALRIGWSAIYWPYEVGLIGMDYAAEALYYAANNGARIASCSWGSSNSGGLGEAIDYFLAAGGLIFKAAGNSFSEAPDYMGTRSDIINVAATKADDCKADFSNFGTWVDISAPGVDILSLYHDKYDPVQDDVANKSGTSMAAPLAASVAALIWSQSPGLSAEQVKQRLLDTADPIDQLNCNALYAGKLGAGRINVNEAVKNWLPLKDELTIDFGTSGLWVYDGSWTRLNGNNTVDMVVVDIDGDGQDELVVSFESFGMYVYDETDGWIKLNSQMPDAMMVFGNNLVIDFGTSGLWLYDGGWTRLNGNNAVDMVLVDIDGDGQDELVVSFESLGMYIYDETDGWIKLNSQMPDAMMVFGNNLVIDFGTSGLWLYDGGWTRLNGNNAVDMVLVDIDDDGKDELMVCFESLGMYIYDETEGWSKFNSQMLDAMMAFGNTLVIDFGTSGLWVYDGSWIRLNGNNAVDMVAVDVDDDGKNELVVCFESLGIYIYDETNGWSKFNSQIPEQMLAIDLKE